MNNPAEPSIPLRLLQILKTFDSLSGREEREMLLLGYAERFTPVPRSIAVPPYPPERRVPYCESDGYVWVVGNPDGTINAHFAVENPSGISAKALAAILTEGLQGAKPEEAAAVTEDIVERVFRHNLSMGKGMGLTAMARKVAAEARARSANRGKRGE
jgi:cysteine desulfuration protein SufE